MIVRPYEAADLHKCTVLFIDVFNQAPWNDQWNPETAEQYLDDFTLSPGFRGFVAEDGEQIRGFAVGVCRRWWS